MFSSLGLFAPLRCPSTNCSLGNICPFSHNPAAANLTPDLEIPVTAAQTTVPAKRPAPLARASSSSSRVPATPTEPPKKLQRVGTTRHPQAVATNTITSACPTLKLSPAQSYVAIPVRQAMLKSLYDHFVVLYDSIMSRHPTLASEHALRQETEIYKASTKLTYRNAIIQSCAALKRREIPDSISHPSVGTQADLQSRQMTKDSLASIRLTPRILEPYLMSEEALRQWGYILEVPNVIGSTKPSKEGESATCERCGKMYLVRRNPPPEECHHHFGRLYTKKANGEKARVYSCCGLTLNDAEGCTRGPHVFYENDVIDLHKRHAFSELKRKNGGSSSLDVVALDCEMVYTTGGLRVARVSMVDGSGTEVYDELVRMDDDVEVVDYITRFSGITKDTHSKAVLSLAGIREALDAYINSETIIIGHALENDLKTLRIVHQRCIDTVALFPHPGGHPYRRALRDLAKEHLKINIQTGDASQGHSSLEDALATLDLVRWHISSKLKHSARA